MPNDRIIQEVGELKGLMVGLREDVQETKAGYEKQWKVYGRYQEKTAEAQERVIGLLNQVKSDLKDYKNECDNRYDDANKSRKSADFRYKVKIGALITVITTGMAVLANLGIAAAKIYWNIA